MGARNRCRTLIHVGLRGPEKVDLATPKEIGPVASCMNAAKPHLHKPARLTLSYLVFFRDVN